MIDRTNVADGDAHGLRAAFHQHFGVVRAAARLLGIPSALLDEVALQTFVTAHARGEELREPELARSRLVALAREVAASYREALPAEVAAEPLETVGAEVVARFLAGLAPQSREVWLLAELGGLKAPEVSAELGIGFDAARSRMAELAREFAAVSADAGTEEALRDLVRALDPPAEQRELQLAALAARLAPRSPSAAGPEPGQARWAVPQQGEEEARGAAAGPGGWMTPGTGTTGQPGGAAGLTPGTGTAGQPGGAAGPGAWMTPGTGATGQPGGAAAPGAWMIPGTGATGQVAVAPQADVGAPAPSVPSLGAEPSVAVGPGPTGPAAVSPMPAGTGPWGQAPALPGAEQAPSGGVAPASPGRPALAGAMAVEAGPWGPTSGPIGAAGQPGPTGGMALGTGPMAQPNWPATAGQGSTGGMAPGTGPMGQPNWPATAGQGPTGEMAAGTGPVGQPNWPATAGPGPTGEMAAGTGPVGQPNWPATAGQGSAGGMAAGTGPVGQVIPTAGAAVVAGPSGRPPSAPQRSRSIVAELDVPERDLAERPRRLVPRSSALLIVSLLVLAVAGGGGYLAWRQFQVEETVEEPAPPEPQVEPVPAPEPAAPAPEEAPPPLGPELPPRAPAPAPSTPTAKPEKAGSGASKKKPAEKSDAGTKSGTGGTKKSDPAEELAKRKEQADGADPGRVLVELEYLSAIDKALKAGNWAQALAYVEQHDRELPGGQLVDKFDERRIRALCGMGRASEAQSKAAQILAKRPASKVKAALAESCK